MNIDISKAWLTIQSWINSTIVLLPNIVVALIVLVLFFLLGKVVRRTIINLTGRYERSHTVGLVIGRLTVGIITIIGFFIALMIVIPSITAGQLVGALGVSSIAIGFAFKDILQNFLAGILILLTQPFKIGDQIVVNSYEGTVLNIETRATTIRTYDNFLVVIPNSDMFTDTVKVLTAFDKRRTQYDFGISYNDDIENAKRIIQEILENTEEVLSDPAPDVLTVDLAESSVNIRARWWTAIPQSDWMKVRDRIIISIKKRFDQEKIDIPFPVRTLQVPQGMALNGKDGE